MYAVTKERVVNGVKQWGILDTKDGVTEYFDHKGLLLIQSKNIPVKGLKEAIRLSAPKKAQEKPIENRKIYKDSLEDIGEYVLRQLSGYYMKETESLSKDTYMVSVRNWGNWVIPDYAYEDEDIDENELEDFDWEELSPESYKELRKIHEKLKQKYPYCNFEIETGEKNWIYVKISYRKNF